MNWKPPKSICLLSFLFNSYQPHDTACDFILPSTIPSKPRFEFDNDTDNGSQSKTRVENKNTTTRRLHFEQLLCNQTSHLISETVEDELIGSADGDGLDWEQEQTLEPRKINFFIDSFDSENYWRRKKEREGLQYNAAFAFAFIFTPTNWISI